MTVDTEIFYTKIQTRLFVIPQNVGISYLLPSFWT